MKDNKAIPEYFLCDAVDILMSHYHKINTTSNLLNKKKTWKRDKHHIG